MRAKAAKLTSRKNPIEWRSKEPSRLETFSDAVFAFAVTLIIVSLEVPKTFTELFETMKGTISFAACFAVLFNIWNSQNKFFRRYGLSDSWTVALNGMLMFVVLIYAYPLKFLFGLLFFDNTFTANGHLQKMIHERQIPSLLLIYGAGFTTIHLLFFLMYSNAKRRAAQLQLIAIELFETETNIYMNLICALIGAAAMLMALFLPLSIAGSSGYFYSVLGPAYWIYLSYRGRKRRKRFGVIA